MQITIKPRILAGYRADGARIIILSGDYEAKLVKHLFPNTQAPELALKIYGAFEDEPLFLKCSEYQNEIDWYNLPSDDGYFSV